MFGMESGRPPRDVGVDSAGRLLRQPVAAPFHRNGSGGRCPVLQGFRGGRRIATNHPGTGNDAVMLPLNRSGAIPGRPPKYGATVARDARQAEEKLQ